MSDKEEKRVAEGEKNSVEGSERIMHRGRKKDEKSQKSTLNREWVTNAAQQNSIDLIKCYVAISQKQCWLLEITIAEGSFGDRKHCRQERFTESRE